MGRRDIALVLNQARYGELRTTILLRSPAGYDYCDGCSCYVFQAKLY